MQISKLLPISYTRASYMLWYNVFVELWIYLFVHLFHQTIQQQM